MRCGRSSSSRTVFAALPFLYRCSRSGLSFVCGGMCRGTTATYSAVPTRVEMRRSVGGSIVTITYTEEGIESSEQQKKKREGSGGRRSVRVCLNSVCLQRVSIVQVRCVCLSFGCFTTSGIRLFCLTKANPLQISHASCSDNTCQPNGRGHDFKTNKQ